MAQFDAVRAYTNEQQISPRANLVYEPAAGTTFHIGYARNFTPPAQELIGTTQVTQFDGTTRESVIRSGDPVRAEREHYFDAGVQQVIAPGLTVGLDGSGIGVGAPQFGARRGFFGGIRKTF